MYLVFNIKIFLLDQFHFLSGARSSPRGTGTNKKLAAEAISNLF